MRFDDGFYRRSNGRFAPIVLKNSAVEASGFADSLRPLGGRAESMMGQRQIDQAALFYEFSLERHVPVSHQLRSHREAIARHLADPDTLLIDQLFVQAWGRRPGPAE
jgi:hypothetical protein